MSLDNADFSPGATLAAFPYAKTQRIESSRMCCSVTRGMVVAEEITVAKGIALMEGIAVDGRWCW